VCIAGHAARLLVFGHPTGQRGREKNIVFTVQLGDIVNNGLASEFAQASSVFKIFDNNDYALREDDRRGTQPHR